MSNLLKEESANGSLEKRVLELGDHCLGSTPKYTQRRKVSAVRDFPKMCGPNVHLVHSNAEGNVVTMENDRLSREVVPSPLVELEVSDGLSLNKGNPNPSGLNEKFRRRRVSAIRDFPRFCGPNVVEPTGQTSFVHLRRDGMVASSVFNMESTLAKTAGHGREESLEGDLHGSQIEKSKSQQVVSDCADKSVFLESKHTKDIVSWRGAYKVVAKKSNFAGDLSKRNSFSAGRINDGSPGSNIGKAKREYNTDCAKHREAAASSSIPYCPWKQEKSPSSKSLGVRKGSKVKKDIFSRRGAHNAVVKKSNFAGDLSKRNSFSAGKIIDGSQGNREYDTDCAKRDEAAAASSSVRSSSKGIDVSSKSSISSDARMRVKDTLRFFQLKCKKILQEEEAKSEQSGTRPEKKKKKKGERIDLKAAKMVRADQKEVNKGKNIGAVPGVEVGDEFQYRVELALIGVHHNYQNGIEFTENKEGKRIAISIVASGAYPDDMDNPDVLIYSGQGGNLVGTKKNPEDQKLVTGNLALKNSILERNSVRVIRSSKENKTSRSSGESGKVVKTYVYDGLYKVDRYYTETGKHGKMVFMFELRREPGQPKLPWKEMKRSNKFKKREGICVDDISYGKESSSVCAVNTIDNEKPPSFTYITKMMYPDWYRPSTAKGCDCTGRCSGFHKCWCAVKNGGEIPYNHNGAIVESKPVVYECGPLCKCPPSCYNRVSQRGLSIQLEIFKTKSRGWGVRSLSFIPSGTFICEYTGKVIKEREAEKRTNEDAYLFDIGRKGNNEEGVYTIDAAKHGNVGRFINHSCSPNLYAQDVLYDHGDRRMPHIMLFASENIPCLQELTYNYNYSVNQIYDSNGNIKVKKCFCCSTTCTGRMY